MGIFLFSYSLENQFQDRAGPWGDANQILKNQSLSMPRLSRLGPGLGGAVNITDTGNVACNESIGTSNWCRRARGLEEPQL